MGLTGRMPTLDLQRMPPPDLHHHARKGLKESVPSGTNPRLARQESKKTTKVSESPVDTATETSHRRGLTEPASIGTYSQSVPPWDFQRMPQPDLHHHAHRGLTESIPSGTNPRLV